VSTPSAVTPEDREQGNLKLIVSTPSAVTPEDREQGNLILVSLINT
jgi:hypothetical protein